MNQINWEQAKMLSQQQGQGQRQRQKPLTDGEKAMRRQGNLEALAASAIACVIESRPKFTAEQVTEFSFAVAEAVMKRTEEARAKIIEEFKLS